MTSAWKLIPLAAAIAALGGCASRTVTREVIREQPAQPAAAVVVPAPAPAAAPAAVTIVQPPPAPMETIPPQPAGAYTWIAGHYEWRGNAWMWVPGQWLAGTYRAMPAPLPESPQAPLNGESSSRWVPGYWSFSGTDWVWVRGRWV